MQGAAMEGQIGRAVALLDLTPERVVVGHLARERIPVERGGRREADVAQPLLDAEPAMHLHRVRALLDAGADAREGVRLLVNHRVDAEAAQRGRSREPADPGSHDGDGQILAAHAPSYRVAAIACKKATRSSVTWSTCGASRPSSSQSSRSTSRVPAGTTSTVVMPSSWGTARLRARSSNMAVRAASTACAFMKRA